ncbi:hypothetical protein Vafri_596 [Volvox africanus]|nr:hypothetical protein Vafri_596 [Volvox africanus]
MKGIFENNCLLKASRNWCDIHERPLVEGATATAAKVGGGVSGGIADGSLVFQLRVEHPIYKEVRPYTYDIVAPLLELRSGSFSPVPLPVAPPLPPPLMLKFQEELVAAGVGLEAAMPLREGAAPLASGSATITRAPAGMAPSATPMVASVTSAAMAPVGGNPDFGLQSDINQHQQNRGLPPMPAPALGQHPGGYGGLPSTGQTAAPTAAFYQPPPLSGSVPYDGGAAQPPMYSGGVATVPPAAGAPGMAYPPMTMPRPTEYVPQPNPQQPGYGPHSQLPPLGSVSYPSYYAAPVPYSPVGSTYMPHGQAQYSQPVTQQAMGYMPPPTAPYTDAPPPSPYGVYPGH